MYYLGRNLTCLTHLSDIIAGHVFCSPCSPFSEKRKVKLEIDANVGAVEFQVKLDQEVQFDRDSRRQKYNRLRCLLLVKGLVICFYLGWAGNTLPIRTNIIKVGSMSWLLTCSSNIEPSFIYNIGSDW